ncbi:hypothetical protein [Hyphococcus luteus]|uniref:Uncharacterized protein n=1 Tax=Hyphococcus luteus TaxID=2058213 RepID=A0A2S7K966_9PROT|nr:hypothetical protein [Marinicaulis flavus]PQA88999.1 hypothetical protein CW354_03355 [Marinicaulis flavus]
MIRILLPLAMIAALFFGPMFSEETKGQLSGKTVSIVTGEHFIGDMVECVRDMKLPVGEECESTGELNDSTLVGDALSWSALLAAVAAVLGVPGLLPYIGRMTSIVTVVSGVAMLGSLGLFMTTMIGAEPGLGAVQWGAYLTAGLALLTVISGLSGMRGR